MTKAVAKRKTKRSKALIERLLACLENGGTVAGFCREPDTPTARAIDMWKESDAALASAVAGARARGCDAMEQLYQDISNTPMMVEVMNGEKTALVVHPDDVQHRRLQMHALEKRMTWNNPAKYGTKMTVEGKMKHTIELTDAERMVRLEQLTEKARVKASVEIGEPHDEPPTTPEAPQPSPWRPSRERIEE